MEEQRTRARAAQKKEVISLSQIETTTPTKFVGYEKLETRGQGSGSGVAKDKTAVILDTSACYAEMGGQVGDTGELEQRQPTLACRRTRRNRGIHGCISSGMRSCRAKLQIANRKSQIHPIFQRSVPRSRSRWTRSRRNAIQRHHTVTHLLHWALHEVVSRTHRKKARLSVRTS